MRFYSLFLLPGLLCKPAVTQSPPNATVHLYRTGLRGPAIQIKMDGKKAFKIGDHKGVTFSIRPGYHLLSADVNHQEPTTAIQAMAGKEYYFDLDAEMQGEKRAILTAGFGGPAQLIMNLVRIDSAPDEKIHEEKLDFKELQELADSTYIETGSQPVRLATASLTDDEIAAAILQGQHDSDPNQVGLRLNDTAVNLASHVLTPDYAVSGFTVIVFSPSRWVEYQSAVAKRELRPFTTEDVTPEMRIKALHVVALPSTPDRLNGQNMSAASGVLRVAICDKKCTTTVQPMTEEHGALELDSALRSMDYTKVASTFNMAEVDALRHTPGAEAFYIAVVGENGSRKLFEVRNRLFSWM